MSAPEASNDRNASPRGPKDPSGPLNSNPKGPPKRRSRSGPNGIPPKPKPLHEGLRGGSREARRRAAVVLAALAGAVTPTEAATALGVSLSCYYLLETRALLGLRKACEPTPTGRVESPERRIERLTKEADRLRNEVTRLQALLRAAQRTIGLNLHLASSLDQKPVKGKGATKGDGRGKRRKKRKPVARALKAAAELQKDEPTPPESQGPPPGEPPGALKKNNEENDAAS